MTERPDIIWIYCDELRADALRCYGHPVWRPHTPNIDRLAAGGVRFTNHFCNSPVCVSSRVATLCALPPERTGVYNNEGAWKHFRLPRLPLAFPQVFARAGYQTANFGKVHVATPMYPGVTPGYDLFQHHNPEGGEMGFWSKLGEEGVRMIRSPNGGMQGGVYPDGIPYPPAKVTDNALAWMENARRPFLCRLSILQPHTPVLPPAGFHAAHAGTDPGLPERLPDTASPLERRTAEVHGLDRMEPELLRQSRRDYLAQVEWVDTQVGRVLDYLEKAGRLEKTVIVFGADHGTPNGDTGAFEKHTFAPCVHRVPFIVRLPGGARAGQVRTDICDSIDLARTLLAAAGLPSPEEFRGRDLFSAPAPEAIFSTIGFGEKDSRMGPNGGRGTWYGDRGWPRRGCVRTARYRFEKTLRIDGAPPPAGGEEPFLADVEKDPREVVNLAGRPEHAATVAHLSALLDRNVENAVEIPRECLRSV